VNEIAHRPRFSKARSAFPWILAGLSAAGLVSWILMLGPTLVNDEYAAIDYCHRVIHQGGFYPTPTRLHKPLAVLTGLSALPAGPLGYELVTAAWAVVFVLFSFLAVRRALGEKIALVASILIASNPDLFLYAAQGITVVPLLAGGFLCIHAMLQWDENPRALWRYAVVAFLIGLLRPDAWLFGIPLAVAFWPRRQKWGYLRFLLAGSIIGLAPVIWFGKDWWINGNLLHSVDVAMRDKAVGLAKIHFTTLEALAFFPKHIIPRISWPALFLLRQRGRGFFHPLILFPLLISAFVWYLIRSGVYPIQRYFYFTALFLVLFAGYGWMEAGQWLKTRQSPWRWAGIGFLVLLAGIHLIMAGRRFQLNYQELQHEAQIQQEMIPIARELQAQIPPGERPRILLPARRDEQLSWLFRHREIPNTLTFREAEYYQFIYHYPFLNFEPRWILYIAGDFHWHWVADEFQWLGHQDHTELQGATIDLFFATDLIRLFRVAYPPDWQTPPPPPPIRSVE
jgi:hypothetical protein